MSVTFYPESLDFGAVSAGSVGPPPPVNDGPDFQGGLGTVMFWGGQNSPAGNITASIQGDYTHFMVGGVIALKVFVVHGLHYREVNSSDGVRPCPVALGQAVAVQVQYDAKTAIGTLTATLVIHGDTPAWAPDSLIPLTLLVDPVRTIGTEFGSLFVSISPGGQGSIPIKVTNVTGPATEVTYSLPLGWAPSTSVKGVPMESGLAMDVNTFHQVPAGGTQSGSLRFTLPRSTLPAGSYPFNIAMTAFDGVLPNSAVTPPLTLVVTSGQTSVAFLDPNPIQLHLGESATVSVVATATMSAVDYIAIDLVPVNLPAGVTMRSISDILSDNPDTLPALPPPNLDPNGSRTFKMTINVDPHAALGNFTLTIDWTATLQGMGPDVGGPPQTGSITTPLTISPETAAFFLDQPVSQPSQENNPKPLVCDRAILTCGNDGTWNFEAHFRNEETLEDVSFLFEVLLNFVDSSGTQFGDTIDGALSAAGDGPATMIGLRILGYPPSGTYKRHGTFEAFQRPAYWANIKNTNAQWRILAAWGNPNPQDRPGPPDVPDQ